MIYCAFIKPITARSRFVTYHA